MRNKGGFTLIELVIVITILAILAAVAIPAFSNLTSQARNAGTQGALGGLRSGLAIYKANELASGRTGTYPPSGAVGTSAMDGGIVPDNPLCKSLAACSSPNLLTPAGVGSPTRTLYGTSAGWAYDVGSGLIYANTNASPGENAY